MSGKTVLILGGGTGGLVAANRLRRMLPKEHRVILADRSPQYSFAPSYPWLMLGRRTGPRISRDLRTLEKKGIEVRIGEVQAIDTANKRVTVRDEEVACDYLVIALGAQYSSEEIEGLNKTWTFYHLEGAEGLQEQLPKFEGGRLAIVVSALPYKCPPAPYEGALLLDDYFRKRRMRDAVEITLYTPDRLPLPVAGERIGKELLGMLTRRDIKFRPNVKLKSVDHTGRSLEFEGHDRQPFDMVIATPVHLVPEVLVRAGLAKAGGWMSVDRETLAVPGIEDVYAIGDCVDIRISGGLRLPMAGVFAHGEAEVVARNIAAEINGGEPVWAYGGQGACFLETGGGKSAYLDGNFYSDPITAAMRRPGRWWHWTKLGFERTWLWRWF